ncbi:hypothetical protein [Paraglaciecola hydrolytica]|uniref:Uncharacterized protein n=1 Tax=Paraglaciecola hydrolytica TaxID=1799789 RepID=A0A136A3L4_9ALTE|nr:hypothetical protein [Paraglaciecola hydrolytica]KXI29833.1 hypothetical protein AX660_07320 [Paraglaciecola hydrolytica]
MLETQEVSVDFRFLQLDKMQALTLVREVQGATYCPSPNAKYFIGCVPLLESYMDDINHFFIRQKVLESECDILIAVAPESPQHSLSVPLSVNRMLKDIDCQLTIELGVS